MTDSERTAAGSSCDTAAARPRRLVSGRRIANVEKEYHRAPSIVARIRHALAKAAESVPGDAA